MKCAFCDRPREKVLCLISRRDLKEPYICNLCIVNAMTTIFDDHYRLRKAYEKKNTVQTNEKTNGDVRGK